MSLKFSLPKATPFIVLVVLLLIIIYFQSLSIRQGLRIEDTIKAEPVTQIVEPAAMIEEATPEAEPVVKSVKTVKPVVVTAGE
jgi:hypothetical protein